MRKPRPQAFDPNHKQLKTPDPENVDLKGVVAIKPRDKKAPPKATAISKSIGDATKQPRNHDTVVSRYHATMIETMRKAVKQFGKEAATHRFTIEEKNAVADVVYSYKRLGIRTSENELTRIAVNFILEDQKENGENSVLDKVLKALNK